MFRIGYSAPVVVVIGYLKARAQETPRWANPEIFDASSAVRSSYINAIQSGILVLQRLGNNDLPV